MIKFLVDIDFDANAVTKPLSESKRRVLSRLGFLIRQEGQGLIRRISGHARPGSPPHDQTGILKRFITYDVNAAEGSVLVGPKLLQRKSKDVVRSLEKGGVSRNWRGRYQRVEARPFMQPALKTVQSQHIPAVFENSFR